MEHKIFNFIQKKKKKSHIISLWSLGGAFYRRKGSSEPVFWVVIAE